VSQQAEVAGICERCGKPVRYVVANIDCDGNPEYVSDGYFQDRGFFEPREWFHAQCEDMKPLKRHLLPWAHMVAS
jgi:hypothetical protein